MKKVKETKIFVGQKAFIRKGEKVLVLIDPDHIIDGQKGLDFPGGRYRWGGSPEGELTREVNEETGLKIKIGRPFTVWTNKAYKTLTGSNLPIYLVGFMCEYVRGKITLSDEHVGFEWVDKESYKKWDDGSNYFKALEEYFNQITNV